MTEADRKAFENFVSAYDGSHLASAVAVAAWQAALLYARIKGGSSERHARHHAIALEQCAVFIADGIDNGSKAISKAMAEAADFLRSAYSPPAESEELERLRKALNLAANRLHRISIEEFSLKADAHDWHNEARSALAASLAPVDDGNIKFVPIDANTGRRTVKVPEGQTPLDGSLHHPLLDVFNEGIKARDSGEVSPYHGHSLEHCIHAAGWVQRDLRIALDKARTPAGKLTP